jgi:hypothetical protein
LDNLCGQLMHAYHRKSVRGFGDLATIACVTEHKVASSLRLASEVLIYFGNNLELKLPTHPILI